MRTETELFRAAEIEREGLESIVRSRSLPHGLVRRARIILMSPVGVHMQEIAQACKTRRAALSQ